MLTTNNNPDLPASSQALFSYHFWTLYTEGSARSVSLYFPSPLPCLSAQMLLYIWNPQKVDSRQCSIGRIFKKKLRTHCVESLVLINNTQPSYPLHYLLKMQRALASWSLKTKTKTKRARSLRALSLVLLLSNTKWPWCYTRVTGLFFPKSRLSHAVV